MAGMCQIMGNGIPYIMWTKRLALAIGLLRQKNALCALFLLVITTQQSITAIFLVLGLMLSSGVLQRQATIATVLLIMGWIIVVRISVTVLTFANTMVMQSVASKITL